MGKTAVVVQIQLKVDNIPQMMAALDALDNRDVLVGFPAEDDLGRYRETGSEKTGIQKEPDPLNNATIGYLLNTGTSTIPPREFMASGVESVKDKIVSASEKTGRRALEGDLAAVEKGQIAIGLIAENGIKGKITDGPFQKLADSTLAARRRRGRTGDRPLNDTGQLSNAVKSVVRKREPK